MNSTKFNMYAAGGIGMLLLFLLLNFFSNLLYLGPEHSGEEPLAFAVAVDNASAKKEAPAKTDFVKLVANVDVAKGEKIFNKCHACHKKEKGQNSVGPSLYDVVGRKVAVEPGYSYSDAMKNHGGVWSLARMEKFLGDPRKVVPGTKMGFAGLKDPQDRVDVIAYLNQNGDKPVDLKAEAEQANAAEGIGAKDASAGGAKDAAKPAAKGSGG